MGRPLVTVITPVYNPGVFLCPAVESMLAQTAGDFEFLLCDDGSSDGSRDYLSGLADTRVRLTVNANNLGPAATRNRAIDEAHGEFVAFLNHDDVAHPTRLARQLDFLRAHPKIDLLGTAITTVDGEGRALPCPYLPPDDLGIRWQGLTECPLRQSTLMVRREFLERHALRYAPIFRTHSDYDFVMRALRHGRAANLPEALVCYHRHGGSLSTTARPELIAEGNRIALAAIRHELPDFPITAEAVAELRALLLNYQPASFGRPLARTKLAWQLYLDLLDRFREKYRDEPALALLPSRSTPPLS